MNALLSLEGAVVSHRSERAVLRAEHFVCPGEERSRAIEIPVGVVLPAESQHQQVSEFSSDAVGRKNHMLLSSGKCTLLAKRKALKNSQHSRVTNAKFLPKKTALTNYCDALALSEHTDTRSTADVMRKIPARSKDLVLSSDRKNITDSCKSSTNAEQHNEPGVKSGNALNVFPRVYASTSPDQQSLANASRTAIRISGVKLSSRFSIHLGQNIFIPRPYTPVNVRQIEFSETHPNTVGMSMSRRFAYRSAGSVRKPVLRACHCHRDRSTLPPRHAITTRKLRAETLLETHTQSHHKVYFNHH